MCLACVGFGSSQQQIGAVSQTANGSSIDEAENSEPLSRPSPARAAEMAQ